MTKELVKDIIEWDITNWSKALDFWSDNVDTRTIENSCLELGGRRGGLSLWLALNDNEVICSDLESPANDASVLHRKYSCGDRITYQAIDATDIPFENKFDLVVFKSILGGISRDGNDELKKKTIEEIHKSLKPSGKLLFAENLAASAMHQALRRKFIKWGSGWNYLRYEDIDSLFSSFKNVEYHTVGFFAAFGRTEGQRELLGFVDAIIRPMIPKSKRYIVFGIAEK